VILAAGTPQILLPWDNATVFKRNFSEYTQGRFASWTAWSAPSTMSVAEAARRNGMSEADLRAVNSIPPRMLIKSGSVLIVPRNSAMQRDVAGHVADNAQLSLAPEIVTRRMVVKAGKNDSVASIARRYRVSPAQVADWNDVSSGASFKPGQQVVLHVPARGTPRVAVKVPAKAVVRTSTRAVPQRATAPVKATARAPVKAAPKTTAKAPAKAPVKPTAKGTTPTMR
jgi:membrane-bound lytic murein transglycosylase D